MSETGPSDRVGAFIHVMNKWELDSWAAARRARSTPDPSSYVDECTLALVQIVREFCVSAHAASNGMTSFQRPPRYDPSVERVVLESREPNGDALVETLHEGGSVLDAGRYRYHLRQEGGKWRIARLERQDRGRWMEDALPMPSIT